MTPTPEQLAIIDAAKTTKANLLVNALAGAAKTTTLQLICEAVQGVPTLSLAFNKKIAEEMTKRLPSHVKCQTLNSLGHGVWSKSLGKKVTLDFQKTGNFVKEYIQALPKSSQREAYDVMGTAIRWIGLAKSHGYIPDGAYPAIPRLCTAEEFFPAIDEEGEDCRLLREIVDECLHRSIRAAYNGTIDFADQLYMPTLFGGTFPSFPLVLVDEAQDLSPLNHAMLQKLARTRLIAVGDPNQSIYGFRGAVSNGMKVLKETFSMTELALSVSFRCPEEIVRNVRWRAPSMQWAEWNAGKGSVSSWHEWTEDLIPDGAAIICRNNAPLYRLAFELIAAGRGVTVVGADIGPQLIKALKKLGDTKVEQPQVLTLIDRWESEKLQKSKSPGSIADRAECLRIFARSGPNLGAAIAFAETLFASAGPIQLMSGHKSKGLEFDTVIHLDPWRVPSKWAISPEAVEQEQNVKYVIDTRAKSHLIYADAEGFHAA